MESDTVSAVAMVVRDVFGESPEDYHSLDEFAKRAAPLKLPRVTLEQVSPFADRHPPPPPLCPPLAPPCKRQTHTHTHREGVGAHGREKRSGLQLGNGEWSSANLNASGSTTCGPHS